MSKPIVIIESPFAGTIERNVSFARHCLHDSIMRGEAPFASHLLYTQPGVLDDDVPEERRLGIETGWEFYRVASKVAVYTNLGFSSGMEAGIRRAEMLGLPIERRYLDIEGWDDHKLPFPPQPEEEPQEAPADAVRRIVQGLRIRWAMRTPVIVREAMLALADQIERDHE